MHFTSPLFLFGICAIAIPILIHLFNFRRYKNVYFSNVKLLQVILQKTKRESTLQHLIVLLLRILGIIALAFAFAQPYLPNRKFEVQERKIVTIFLDNSFSMGAQNQHTSLLNEAFDAAKNIAEAYSYNDEFVLITNDFYAREAQIINKDELLSRLEDIEITSNNKNLEQILHFSENVLAKSQKTKKICYLISDFQKRQFDFQSIQIDSNLQILLYQIVNKSANNISIDSCYFNMPVFQVGYNVGQTVRICNYSNEEVVKLPVKLYINNEQRALGAVDIKPNSYTDVTLNYPIQHTGIQEGMIEIYDTPITFDDRFYFVYEVVPKASVIALQENYKNQYLQALYGADSLFSYQTMHVTQIDYNAFASAQLIILDQLESMSTGLAAELEKYVMNGGSLVVFPAEKMDVSIFKPLFAIFNIPNYAELLSGEMKVTSLNRESIFFKGAFEKNDSENWEMPTVTHYYIFENKVVPSEKIMCLENNAPFLSSYKYGKGDVALSSVALNDFYGNAHKNAIFFVPLHVFGIMGKMKNSLFNYIGSNDVVIVSQKAMGSEDIFVIKSRDSGMEFIPEQRNLGNGSQIFFQSQIMQPGFYNVMKGGISCATLAFNYQRVESHLEYYSEQELENIARHTDGQILILSTNTKNLTRFIEENMKGKKLWHYFVWAALICLFTEILILRFWRIGVKFK